MERIIQALRSKGYAIDGPSIPTSRPDRGAIAMVTRKRVPVVAKLYPPGGGEITFANMQEVWRREGLAQRY